MTVEAVRHRVPATVVKTPFFNPPRKTARPCADVAALEPDREDRNGSASRSKEILGALRPAGSRSRRPGRSRPPGTSTSASPSSSAGRFSAHLAAGRPRSTRSRSPASSSRRSRRRADPGGARQDGVLRGFFNVCRHHAAAVMTEDRGQGARCSAAPTTAGPTPSTGGSRHAGLRRRLQLRPRQQRPGAGGGRRCGRTSCSCALDAGRPAARRVPGPTWSSQIRAAAASTRCTSSSAAHYTFDCNWKVFVDNYLDGGYHVPHLHPGLASVLDYSRVHDRERRPLLPAVEPDDALGRRRGRRARRARGRPRALLLGLPELHDQLVRGRDGHQPRAAARRRTAPR